MERIPNRQHFRAGSVYKKWNWLSLLIAVANGAIFLRMQLSGAFDAHASRDALVNWGGVIGVKAFNGEIWRFFSSQFVHAGLRHFLGNMCALFLVAPFLISALGTLPTALIYLTCGWLGNAAAAVTDPYAVVVGASGAIFGLYGALISAFLAGRFGRHSHLDRDQLKRALWLTLPLSLMTSSLPGISVAANFGGMITGCLLGFSLTRRSFISRYSWATVSVVTAFFGIFLVTALLQGTSAKMFQIFASELPKISSQISNIDRVSTEYGNIHAQVSASIEKLKQGEGPTLKAMPKPEGQANQVDDAIAYFELEQRYRSDLAKNTDGNKGIQALNQIFEREAARIGTNWKEVQIKLRGRSTASPK